MRLLPIPSLIRVLICSPLVFSLTVTTPAVGEGKGESSAVKSLETQNPLMGDHPCAGKKGVPYRKYTRFEIKDGELIKYRANGSPKSEPTRHSSVESFFKEKGIRAACGAEEHADLDEKTTAPPKRKTPPEQKSEPVKAGQNKFQFNGQPIGDPMVRALPLTARVENYYGGEGALIKKEVNDEVEALEVTFTRVDEELKDYLYEVLAYIHVQTEDFRTPTNGTLISTPDSFHSECPQSVEKSSYSQCVGPLVYSYPAARKLMFGLIDLESKQLNKKNGEEPAVFDVYCQRYASAKDFPQGQGPGELKIPLHEILNAEHTWPQSRFNKNFPKTMQKTDLHHLYPTDNRHNGRRGNFEFATVVTPSKKLRVTCEGNAVGYPKEVSSGQVYYEVPDAHKGNVARSLFYFSVRYKISISEVEEKYMRQWHEQDPVDEGDVHRNEAIYQLQGNRNPFIDYPELVDAISDF